MKPCTLVLAALGLLAIAGCRSDPAIPILERQLRLQEDEIYRLRAKLEGLQDCDSSYSDQGDDSRSDRWSAPESEPPRRRRSGSSATSGATPPAVELPSRPATEVPDSLKSPAGSLPPGVPDVPEYLREPSKPLDPADADGPSLDRSEDEAARRSSRATVASRSARAVPITPSDDSRLVASIVLNRVLTGGISAEDGSGDQGVLVVVEPRDRAGRTVAAPAEMSVVVLDPALEGNAARVARWDFPASKTGAMFRRTGSTAAIHLTTAWPDNPPKHNKLHLFVRYVTDDGRNIDTNMPIEVALAGDNVARWNRSDRSADRGAVSSTARAPRAAPHAAAQSDEAKSRRPAWSPERR